MKRKTSALLFSLFFVSSGIAINVVKTDSTANVFPGRVATLPSVNKQLNVAQLSNDPQQQPATLAKNNNTNVAPVPNKPISDDSLAVNESDFLLVETKEDKNRLKQQTRALTREREKQITASLNAQSNLALKQQLAKQGKPSATSEPTEQVVATPMSTVTLANQSEPSTDNSNEETPLVAINNTQLTLEQQLNKKRKALDLAPPIPPGTFGGGNGNGGPGGAAVTASAN